MLYKKTNNFLCTLLIALTCCTHVIAQPISSDPATVNQSLVSQDFIQGIESKPLLLSNAQNPQQLNGSVYQLIERAQSSVLIITFSLDDSKTIELLNQKAAQGIDVHVLIDQNHLSNTKLKLNPSIRLGTRGGEGHLHHKILVIDHGLIWLGSGNFTNHSFRDTKNLSIGFFSPEVAIALHEEAHFIETQNPRTDDGVQHCEINGQSLDLYILPHNQPGKQRPVETKMNDFAKRKLIDLIDNAQSSIQASIDIWTHKDLAQAFVRAKQKGIHIELTTRPGQDQDPAIKMMRDSGVDIKAKSGLHYKFMVIDNRVLFNGSPNLSVNAFTRSDESFVLLYDLTSDQQDVLHRIWENQ